MEGSLNKIKSFTDLNAWKQGHELVLTVYKLTKQFPKEENYRLVNQICRAVVSITSNLAEGFSRNSSKEKLQFYAISLGSLSEVQNQIIIAKDLNYVGLEDFKNTEEQIVKVSKLINGLMGSVSNRYT